MTLNGVGPPTRAVSALAELLVCDAGDVNKMSQLNAQWRLQCTLNDQKLPEYQMQLCAIDIVSLVLTFKAHYLLSRAVHIACEYGPW